MRPGERTACGIAALEGNDEAGDLGGKGRHVGDAVRGGCLAVEPAAH
jgi:hypothetical protein